MTQSQTLMEALHYKWQHVLIETQWDHFSFLSMLLFQFLHLCLSFPSSTLTSPLLSIFVILLVLSSSSCSPASPRPSPPPPPAPSLLLYLSAARCGRFLLNDAGGGRQNCNMAEPMARKNQPGQHETSSWGSRWRRRRRRAKE